MIKLIRIKNIEIYQRNYKKYVRDTEDGGKRLKCYKLDIQEKMKKTIIQNISELNKSMNIQMKKV